MVEHFPDQVCLPPLGIIQIRASHPALCMVEESLYHTLYTLGASRYTLSSPDQYKFEYHCAMLTCTSALRCLARRNQWPVPWYGRFPRTGSERVSS
jgi:hypothetical protein